VAVGERIIPVLVYADIAAAHDFLVNAFGFSSGGVHRDAEGRAVHGEVRLGDFVIWLHREVGDLRLASPRSASFNTSGLTVYVTDVDAHFTRARLAGATIESEPRDMDYGQREYGAVDPEGHRWWFATPRP
jgi:uncharacterized glyoxalase superfamily protein PhnB